MIRQLNETVTYLENSGFKNPEVGIILGTGLGLFVNELKIIKELSYDEIPNFPVATVVSHKGKLIYGKLEDKNVIVMQGRFHLYEEYTLQEVTFPIRVMEKLGIKVLLVSNAAGAINLNFKKSELMLIEDHINLQGNSPLAFKGVSQLGERFTDMSEPYSIRLNAIVQGIAKTTGIKLQKGVYAAVVGPQLETRAEYKMLQIIGADAVGMSTVPEVIVARHLNLEVVAISVLTDECDPDHLESANIDDIIAMAAIAEPDLTLLLTTLIKRL